MEYLKRFIALPFFAGLSLIHVIVLWSIYCVNFVRFGGEAIAYTNKNTRKTIKDIYNVLAKDGHD